MTPKIKTKESKMGWGSGSEFAEKLWQDIKEFIPQEKHQELARRIYDFFAWEDADAWWHSKGSLAPTAYPDTIKAL